MRPVRLYAHRGGTEHGPENSWAAFESAHRLGIRYLETDARVTRDGVCVAHHDATLDRTTDRSGRLVDLPWASVAKARMTGDQTVPRLDDLLATFPDCHVNIDLKEAAVIAPTLDVLARAIAWSRVTLTSFSGARLRAARRRIPVQTETSATPREVAVLLGASWGLRRYPRIVGDRLQVPDRLRDRIVVTPEFIRTAQGLGCPVDVWTVNDPVDMRRLLSWGVDGIMTDRPGVLLAIAEESGRPQARPVLSPVIDRSSSPE